MTTQRTFFGFASTSTTQRGLFAADGPEVSAMRCQCGRNLIRTDSGYLCCPRGHGRLIDEAAIDNTHEEIDR